MHNRLFTVTDWVPTLAEAAGFDTGGAQFDGVSLWKGLLGETPVARPAAVLGGGANSAVFHGDFKFVEQTTGQNTCQFLFQIFEDPNETMDVKAEYPAIAAEMLATLRARPRGQADRL